MKSNWEINKTTMAAAAWILGISMTGFGTGTESLMGWFMVSVMALGPATVLLHFSNPMPQTIAPGSRQARR